VWWHGRTWIGRFPIDYYGALVTSLALAASARLTTGNFDVLAHHVASTIVTLALTALAFAGAPAYMRWYAHMRRPNSDERSRVLPSER
jgi:hypothetical protein